MNKLDLNMTNATKKKYKELFNTLVASSEMQKVDVDKLATLYGIVNNDVTVIKKELDKYCNKLGIIFPELDDLIDNSVEVYNVLFNNLQHLANQAFFRHIDYDVVPVSDSYNDIKTQELKEKARQIVVESTMMMDPNMSDEELDQQLQESGILEEIEKIKDYKTRIEVFYNKLIDYFKFKNNPQKLIRDLMVHTIVSSRFGISLDDNLNAKIENPLRFKIESSPDTEYYSSAPVQVRTEYITWRDAYHYLKNKVSDKELEQFSTLSSGGAYTRGSTIGKKDSFPEYDYRFMQFDLDQDNKSVADRRLGLNTNPDAFNFLIPKTTLYFIGYRTVLYITYIDQFGKKIEDIISYDKDFIPEEAEKVEHLDRWMNNTYRYEWIDDFGNPMSAEILEVPRRYEVTRWNYELFTDYRECPFQPLSIDEIDKINNQIKGKTFDAVNAEPISILERTLPLYLQLLLVKRKQNEEISKYEGQVKETDLSKIPDYLGYDGSGKPLIEGASKEGLYEYFRQAFGRSYVDNNARVGTGGLMNTTSASRSIQASSFAEILNMANFIEILNREISMMMLVPPASKGIYQKYSNATDNQQATQVAQAMSEIYFLEIEEVLRQLIVEFISKTVNKYKLFFELHPDVEETYLYYMTDKEESEAIAITPDLLDIEALGLFVKNTTASKQYREYMLSASQAFAQNRGEGMEEISRLMMGLFNGDSPQKIHFQLAELAEKQRLRNEQAQKQMQEMEMQKSQQEAALRKEEMDLERYKIDANNKARVESAAMISLKGNAQGEDDQDGIPQQIEVLEKLRRLDQEDRKIAQKDKEIAIKERSSREKKSN